MDWAREGFSATIKTVLIFEGCAARCFGPTFKLSSLQGREDSGHSVQNFERDHIWMVSSSSTIKCSVREWQLSMGILSHIQRRVSGYFFPGQLKHFLCLIQLWVPVRIKRHTVCIRFKPKKQTQCIYKIATNYKFDWRVFQYLSILRTSTPISLRS